MLPPELLRVVFDFIADVECRASAHGQVSSIRYQYELESGYKQIQTKRSLLLVSRAFHELALELAWSWVSILSWDRMQRIDSLLKDGFQSGVGAVDGREEFVTYYPSRWIRRLDISHHFPARIYGDDSSVLQTIVRIIRACPRLNVLVTDLSVGGVDCQRSSRILLDAIKQSNITRLDFAGHEGPSLIDYIDLVHHLPNLEQLTTGRIAEPRMEEEDILDTIRQLGYRPSLGDEESREGFGDSLPPFSLPNLSIIHFSHRPLLSCLRLFSHIYLPKLQIIAMRNILFDVVRVETFFKLFGHRITHIYTNDIRTSEEPFGYARVLQLCPNLVHLTFSPRQDGRHSEKWEHSHLSSLGLRGVLPQTLPDDEELVGNISRSLERFLARIIEACLSNRLPSLRLIRIEDDGLVARKMIGSYGSNWAEACRRTSLTLENNYGEPISRECVEQVGSTVEANHRENQYGEDAAARSGTISRIVRKFTKLLDHEILPRSK